MADGGNVIFKFLGDDKQLKSTMNTIGNVAKTSMKALEVGTLAVAGAFTTVVTQSVKARGEMEQLVGGAKKIFDEMDFSIIEKDAR